MYDGKAASEIFNKSWFGQKSIQHCDYPCGG